jgi:hypothetical protein
MTPRLSALSTRVVVIAALLVLAVWRPAVVLVQDDPSTAGKRLYEDVKRFALTGGSIEVANLKLARDRVEMTFTGTFHLGSAGTDRVSGAVFIGQGTLRATVPPNEFERDNVRRLIGADLVESDFKTAVLRWSDDTLKLIDGKRTEGGAAPEQATRLASEFDARFLQETGANLSARIATSILDQQAPGVFFAQVDGGRRGRFNVLLDHQGWVPVSNFGINGGEKGLIFAHQAGLYLNEVWMAFYAQADYERGQVAYSDTSDLIDIRHYQVDVDLRQFDRRIGVNSRIEAEVRQPNVRAIPFKIGESLSIYERARLENQLRVKAARIGGKPVSWVQEDWEGGFTVFLPQAAAIGESITIEVDLDGNFMRRATEFAYPMSNTAWLPRHGYLDRSTFDLTYRHRTREKVASIGTRLSEQPDAAERDVTVTKYQMKEPVALAVFALGPYERKVEPVKFEGTAVAIQIEVNSLPARVMPVKADFILAELGNAIRYFAAMFGAYPYSNFGAAFHPYGFGQGFPTMMMLPPVDQAEKNTFSFLAHETAHQWWGNIVAWRSYRDQWLSEGFAEYSGILYTFARDKERPRSALELIRDARQSLLDTPRTALGVGRGRSNDIGPIILGLRLNTTQSAGAYQTLIYNKGALVLRMLHFLMTNPTNADDKAFNAMMTAFVERYRNKSASTEEFRAVANEHFARTPIAQKYGLKDLNWFFKQWVYETGLPSYELAYSLKEQPDGKVMLSGVVTQTSVSAEWFMPLPILMTFDGNQEARTTVGARGASTTFELSLPARPRKVELDPLSWVLSEKTTTRAR